MVEQCKDLTNVFYKILGCAVGAAKAGDCQSGAAGAVIGEVIAEAAGKSLIKDGEFSDTDEWLTRTAGTTAAIFGTSALGGDFNVASDTAQNAIDNNALWLLDYLFSAEELGNAELYPEEKEEEENQDEITEAILTAGAIAKCVTKAKGCLNILKKKPSTNNSKEFIGQNAKVFGRFSSGRNKGYIKVKSELNGRLQGAKNLFKNLTGKKPTRNFNRIVLKDGREIIFRQTSKSGPSKIEITNHNTKSWEKISFP